MSGKFHDSMLPGIHQMASQGLSDGQIAVNLGVNCMTFSYWKRTNAALGLTLEKARMPVIQAVENALYQRAIGYPTEELHVEKSRGKKIIKRIKKEVAPDVKAAIFYLTNRLPDKWRFSSKIETKVADETSDGEMDLTNLTDEQLGLLSKTIKEAHGITEE